MSIFPDSKSIFSPDHFLSYVNPEITMRRSGAVSCSNRTGFPVRPDTNIQSLLNSSYKYSTKHVGNKVVLDKETQKILDGERRGHRMKLKKYKPFHLKWYLT